MFDMSFPDAIEALFGACYMFHMYESWWYIPIAVATIMIIALIVRWACREIIL